MKSRRASFVIGLVVVILLVVLDQLTKIWVVNTLKINGPVPLIKDVFEFSYLENQGAAWGMFEGARVFFVILAVVLTIVIGWIYLRIPMEKKYSPLKVTLVLLVSGGLGNMIDRAFNGFVVDFLYFKLINFPIFNVADIYVTISMFLLIILLLFVYKEKDLDFIKKKKEKE